LFHPEILKCLTQLIYGNVSNLIVEVDDTVNDTVKKVPEKQAFNEGSLRRIRIKRRRVRRRFSCR